MKPILEVESTLTDRYQTTVPETVRRALHLSKRDKLSYTIQSDGSVVLSRAESTAARDPALGAFLHFLARDISAHPSAVRGLDGALQARLHSLIGAVDVDLDAPLPDDE